jgi:hypothetical protein
LEGNATAISEATFSTFLTRDNVNKGASFIIPDVCRIYLVSVESWGQNSDTSMTKSFTLKVVNIHPEKQKINVTVKATAMRLTSDIFMQRFVVLPALTCLLRMLLEAGTMDNLFLNKSPYTLTMPTFKHCTLVHLLEWIPDHMRTERTPLVARALESHKGQKLQKPELQTFIAWTYWCNLYFMKRGTSLVKIGFKRAPELVNIDSVVAEIQKQTTQYFLNLKAHGLQFNTTGGTEIPMFRESTREEKSMLALIHAPFGFNPYFESESVLPETTEV